MCQTSSILINIIIKCIIISIVYLSFRYDTGISFMIPIWYDTFDTVHILINSCTLFYVCIQQTDNCITFLIILYQLTNHHGFLDLTFVGWHWSNHPPAQPATDLHHYTNVHNALHSIDQFHAYDPMLQPIIIWQYFEVSNLCNLDQLPGRTNRSFTANIPVTHKWETFFLGEITIFWDGSPNLS